MSNRELIEAFRKFVEVRSKMMGVTDDIHGLQLGSDDEIVLTQTMLSQAAASLSAYEWQPIETAPKDGTPVVRANSSESNVQWWGEDDDGDPAWEPRIRGFIATHWKPQDLPKPITGDE